MFGIEKVQISRDSWHFKWLKFVHFVSVEQATDWNNFDARIGYGTMNVYRAPKSVCPYFWLLMWSFVVVMGATAFAIFLLLVLLVAAGWLAVVIAHNLSATLIGVGFVVGIVAVVLMIMYLFNLLGRYINNKRNRYGPFYYREPRKPGIFRTYIKSKKEKVCPLVEYT